jgi:hypothetical protein
MIRGEMKIRYLAPLLFSWKTLPLDVISPELMMTGDKWQGTGAKIKAED